MAVLLIALRHPQNPFGGTGVNRLVMRVIVRRGQRALVCLLDQGLDKLNPLLPPFWAQERLNLLSK